MRHRIPIYVYATDPLSEAGIVSRLRPQPVIDLVAEDEIGKAVVGVVVASSAASNISAARGSRSSFPTLTTP